MAMVKCPECDGNVSDRAVTCPHCGYPLKQNEATGEYVLIKGSEEKSGFATFLRVLAVICWIGGLIIAIAGAQVTVEYRYSSSTSFSFAAFLTAFLSYFIYGVILMCMATIVDHIAGTYSIMSGLKLERKKTNALSSSAGNGAAQTNRVVQQTNSVDSVSASSSGSSIKTEKPKVPEPPKAVDSSWIPDGDKFTICPQCNYRMTYDFARARKCCPKCGREYKVEA